MSDIKPFQISIPDAQLEDLKERLVRARYPDELDGAGWDYGVPLGEVKRLAKYWADTFDWRKAEAGLNEFPQFTTSIEADGFDPVDVHFVHAKSEVEGAIPLLFLHGWPGSFYEALKIIEPLTRGAEGKPAFHVVVPSLVNYGFSGSATKRGFGVYEQGEVMHKLMLRLGYDEYVTQGGDWGYFITRAMARRYSPLHLKAQHLSLDLFEFPSLWKTPLLAARALVTPWSRREREGMERSKEFRRMGSGYSAVHSTRPQTLGYSLADSPAGLLAWVYEKLKLWTDDYPWTDDEVCTWISIYWFATAGPAASARLYYEFARTFDVVKTNPLTGWIDVKVGLGHFPKDVITLPGLWGQALGHVVFEREHPDGGHFAAWERPDYLVADLRDMFGPKGGAEGVVKGTKSTS